MHIIQTFSGGRFDFLRPETSVFDIVDIAHSLSRICRFTGHTNQFYSVAQHSVLVSENVPADQALAGLMHDASEAFLGDVSSPLKALLPDYRAIEQSVVSEIAFRFGLPVAMSADVHAADRRLLYTEMRDLMPYPAEGPYHAQALPETIAPLPMEAAFDLFMARFQQLAKH
jgi:5'-deoxynucleotidase YfbR-like HD superfamily hydrolase